ncbi:MAG: chemotaxis protein CheW [Oligoflexales bacterium]
MVEQGFVLFEEEDSLQKPSELDSSREIEDIRYLVFSVVDVVFATPLLEAKEVIEMVDYQRVPNTTEYFLGIANVRGDVVGIVDLQSMLNIQSLEKDQDSKCKPVLIVFKTAHGLLGIKVDAIKGVKNISANQIDTEPHIKARVAHEYLLGVAKMSEQLISVIEIKKILCDDDMLTLKRSMAS